MKSGWVGITDDEEMESKIFIELEMWRRAQKATLNQSSIFA